MENRWFCINGHAHISLKNKTNKKANESNENAGMTIWKCINVQYIWDTVTAGDR